MPKFHRILCPVDLSENSFGAIELATLLARQQDAKIAFYYVTPIWEPSTASGLQEYAKQVIEEEKTQLYKVRPTDSIVSFEHHFVHGNPGPEIVKASKKADMVVMNTHGRSGIARLIMGSVANYVLRNAKCPVYLVKQMDIENQRREESGGQTPESQTFVTDIMHQVPPVHAFKTMESVLEGLNKARETAAPVVDGVGKCIGILTTTDIERFHSLQKRFEEKDESVIEEMFEVDEFGQRRSENYNFDQVERHMTKEVICIQDTDTVQDAIDLFEANPKIHHLVVLDEDDLAVGIVDALNTTVDQTVDRQKPVS
jgi:nucleotide-binding universal stress UspA family protein/CBS domain-containing protein